MRRRIWIILIALLLISLPAVKGKAAERVIDFEIPDNFISVTIRLSVQSSAECSAVLRVGEQEYSFLQSDETHLSITLDNVNGAVQAVVTSAEDNIGNCTITMSGKKSDSSYDPEQTIHVGSDIADLKVYFEDSKLCVTWTESDVGKVAVRVVNLRTNTILGKETVSGHDYSCSVAGLSVGERIFVSVCPASSVSIEGAEKTFTLEIPDVPNITVEYKDNLFCSEETEVVVKANEPYSYDAYLNGKLVYSSEILEIGKDYTHAFSGLLEGENTFSIVIIDADGNRTSYPKSLVCDKTPPKITFKYEYDGAIVKVDKLIIEGYVKDCSELFVNDNAVTYSTDGHFEYEVELHNGENEIIVSAYDIAKNLTSAKLHLKCSLPVTKKKPDAPSIIGLILIIIAAVLFVIKGKQHNSTPPKDFTPELKDENNAPANKNIVLDIDNTKVRKKRSFMDMFEKKDKTNPTEENEITIAPGPVYTEFNSEETASQPISSEEINGMKKSFDDLFSEEDNETKEESATTDNLTLTAPASIDDIFNNAPDIDYYDDFVEEPNVTVAASARSNPIAVTVIPAESEYDFSDDDEETDDNDESDHELSISGDSDVAKLDWKKNLERIEAEEHVENCQSYESLTATSPEIIQSAAREADDSEDWQKALEELTDEPETQAKPKEEKVKYSLSTANKTKDKKKKKAVEGESIFTESKRRYKRNDNLRTVLLMGIVIAVFIIIGLFVIQISYIPSDSMNPHICAGDYNIGKRSFIGGTKNINRGDVIMFVHQGDPLVKRVIGLPGEVVTFVDGKVAINGEILDEPYLDENVITKCNNTYTVPDGCYFVLGDNRMYSSDSRTDNQLSSPFFNSPFVPKSEITSVEIVVIPTHGLAKTISDLFN